MKKILFISPWWTSDYGKFNPARYFARAYSQWPPLNLALLATIARNKGFLVNIIDAELKGISRKILYDKIKNIEADFVAFTSTTPYYHIVKEIASFAKMNTNSTILLGGAHVSNCNEKDDDFTMFDFCFKGEAENTWINFLDELPKKESNTIFFESKPIDDIDNIFPDRTLLDYKSYTTMNNFGKKILTSIIHSRGCPFNCIFCSPNGFSKKIRIRSPESFVDEIFWINKTLDINYFGIISDTFTMDKNNVLSICELIKKRGLNINFEAGTRANLIDEELMKEMSSAGLSLISFGLESVDENVRKIMGKNTINIDAYIKANELAIKYGVTTQNSTIIGMPGDTIKSIKKTMLFLRENKNIKQANVSIAVPYPGTKLYEMAINGEHDLSLIESNFSKFKRYGFSVMNVGDLTTKDLKRIQDECFASIYLPIWRWIPTIGRSGIYGLLDKLYRISKMFLSLRWEFLFKRNLKKVNKC
jgi:anaerobic magnesium-protoporphyrin IX monomethyl ester cyclase